MSVAAWQDELPLRTYLLGPPDPNPPWQRTGMARVYPYPMLDDLTDETKVVPYKALHVENDYLHLIVLPELGGRLYSLYDKVAKREVFYRNNVVKYGLVARRGAWISGGIEFNFPQGHTCPTVSPVQSVLQENPETGAASVVIGYTDRVSRMRCSVRLSLAPGEARLRQEVMLHNPMPYRQRHYFWANSAVLARDDLHLVYPATKCRTLGGEFPYPIIAGRDMSWYRNHERPNDIFALDVTEDFFGCYYEEQDVGMVHWSDHRLDFGKKFFTWGTADEGMIWADLLTDSDGQYVEIQSGRFVDQSTFEFLYPFQAVRWTEYWYPLHGMGGFVWATDEAALNWRLHGDTARVSVMANRDLGSAELVMRWNYRPVWRKPCDVRAGQPVVDEVSLAGLPPKEDEAVLCLMAGDRELLRYEDPPDYIARPRIELPKESLRPPDDPEVTAEELCRHAVRAEKLNDPDRAREFYCRALEKDLGCSAARMGIGLLNYQTGIENGNLDHLRMAVERDPDNDEAWYYLALAYLQTAEGPTAEDILWRLMGRSACRREAAIALASGPFAHSPESRIGLLQGSPDGPTVRLHLARVRRELGLPWGAEEEAWLAEDPLDGHLAAERYLRAREQGQESERVFQQLSGILGDDPELWLEVAFTYHGPPHEAAHLLLRGAEVSEAVARWPMTHYLVASSPPVPESGAKRLVRRRPSLAAIVAQSRHGLDEAAAADPEYGFPSRFEEWSVLSWAAMERPQDWKARLLLGTLFASLGRRAEALNRWEEAAEIDDSNPVLCRNIALAKTLWEKDYPEALQWYAKAIARRPDDYHLWLERDNALQASGAGPEERLDAFTEAPGAVFGRWEIAARRVECLVRLERWDEAIEVMQAHTFRPWEGARQMHALWSQALVGRAAQRREAGDPAGALADYELALTYPRNLGVGRAAYPTDAPVHWLAAELAAETDDGAKQTEHLQAAADERHAHLGEADVCKLKALRALGRRDEADELAGKLREWAGKRLAANPEDGGARRVGEGVG